MMQRTQGPQGNMCRCTMCRMQIAATDCEQEKMGKKALRLQPTAAGACMKR